MINNQNLTILDLGECENKLKIEYTFIIGKIFGLFYNLKIIFSVEYFYLSQIVFLLIN